MLLQVTSIKCSGLGIYSAASIMPVLSHWQVACGSYSGSERGNMLLSSDDLPPATAQGYSGSRNLPAAQPGTDVMRDVLRLVDVDPLQNCNGLAYISFKLV
jgi:hypothetical protein